MKETTNTIKPQTPLPECHCPNLRPRPRRSVNAMPFGNLSCPSPSPSPPNERTHVHAVAASVANENQALAVHRNGSRNLKLSHAQLAQEFAVQITDNDALSAKAVIINNENFAIAVSCHPQERLVNISPAGWNKNLPSSPSNTSTHVSVLIQILLSAQTAPRIGACVSNCHKKLGWASRVALRRNKNPKSTPQRRMQTLAKRSPQPFQIDCNQIHNKHLKRAIEIEPKFADAVKMKVGRCRLIELMVSGKSNSRDTSRGQAPTATAAKFI